MKKKLCLLFVFIACVSLLSGCGSKKTKNSAADTSPTVESVSPSPSEAPVATLTPTPTPTPTPIVAPTPSLTPASETEPEPVGTPTPESGLPKITKHPTSESVVEQDGCYFVAKCSNVDFAVWHFVSPNGLEDLTYQEAAQRFKKMDIINGNYPTMQLGHITADINGWSVYCRFSNGVGYVDTDKAMITVLGAAEPDWGTGMGPDAQTQDPSGGTVAPDVNDWVASENLEAAVQGSGVEFTPPIKAARPGKNMTLTFYRFRTGAIEAVYADETGNSLLIRKSNTLSVDELSGDPNTYSSAWDLTVKKWTVHCKGDGKTINNAVFSTDDSNWAVLYNVGREGNGLMTDQLNTLILAMK